jgi:hypothetical protein
MSDLSIPHQKKPLPNIYGAHIIDGGRTHPRSQF